MCIYESIHTVQVFSGPSRTIVTTTVLTGIVFNPFALHSSLCSTHVSFCCLNYLHLHMHFNLHGCARVWEPEICFNKALWQIDSKLSWNRQVLSWKPYSVVFAKSAPGTVQLAVSFPCFSQPPGVSPSVWTVYYRPVSLYSSINSLHCPTNFQSPSSMRLGSLSSILWDLLPCAWIVLWAECRGDYRIMFSICVCLWGSIYGKHPFFSLSKLVY